MQPIESLFDFNRTTLHMPQPRWSDFVEILIIAFLVYHILVWAKNTRLWSLLKGIIVILVFILLAALFNMTTILWIVGRAFGIAFTAMVVILSFERLWRNWVGKSFLPTFWLLGTPRQREDSLTRPSMR